MKKEFEFGDMSVKFNHTVKIENESKLADKEYAN